MNAVPLFVLASLSALGCRSANTAPTGSALPEDRTTSEAAKGARSQLEYLRSLEGAWWGTGGQGTDRNPVEFRYRITDEGRAVEETCFVGTPGQLVTTYRVDGERLVGTRTSATGAPAQLVAAPDHPSYRVSLTGSGSGTTSSCADDPDIGPLITWNQGESREDLNCHCLDFATTDAAVAEGSESQRWPNYDLWIDHWINGTPQILATWRSSGNDGKSEDIRSYHLTRKLPGGVVRTADRGSPAGRDDQGKKSWQSERAYWDLRSEP
jgi:hypothetical protein